MTDVQEHADAPPPYSRLPVDFTPIGDVRPQDHEVKSLPTAAQDVKCEVFQTKWRLKSHASEHFVPNGMLYIGLKTVTNVLEHSVFYKPFMDEGDAELHDISHTISVADTDEKTTQYTKVSDGTSPYSFTIKISDFGLPSTKFKDGTLSIGSDVYDWSGSWVLSQYPVKVEATIDTIPKPENLGDKVSFDELDKIDPAVHVGSWDLAASRDPDSKDAGTKNPSSKDLNSKVSNNKDPNKDPGNKDPENTGLKVGDDGAQYWGDHILQQIMMNAIDDTPGKKFLGEVPPLSSEEQTILSQNSKFFRRGAVHMLCEQIKKQAGMPADVTKHIKWKWDVYLKMLSSTDSPTKPGLDAVKLYGLDRDKDQALIDKLRKQFRNATMACYELGYRKQCPEWTRYLEYPEYWYKVYEQRLLSEEHVTKWLVHTVDTGERAPGARDGKEMVLVWCNKLSLLKHAAESQGKDTTHLDIDHVANTLLTRLHRQPSYSLVLNDEFVKEVTALYDTMEKSKLSKEFKKKYGELKKEAREASDAIRTATPRVLAMLANPHSDLVGSIRDFWNKRLPGGAPKELTVAKVSHGLEMVDLNETAITEEVSRMGESGTSIVQAENKFQALLKKVGNAVVGAVKSLIKYVFHLALQGAAFAFVALFLPSDKTHLSVSEMGTAICAVITESFGLAGRLLGMQSMINWGIKKGGITRSMTAWFGNAMKVAEKAKAGTRVLYSLFGNLSKLIRIIGLVGCVFNLVTSYWGMRAAGDGKNAETARTFSTIQFSLGVVEGILLVGGIAAEMIGAAACAAVLGPLALVVGAITGIVLLVQMIWFAPDPNEEIKSYLGSGLPKEYGSYDPNTEVTWPAMVSLSLATLYSPASMSELEDLLDQMGSKPLTEGDDPKEKQTPRLVIPVEDAAARRVEATIDVYQDAWRAIDPCPWEPMVDTLADFRAFLDDLVTGHFFWDAFARYETGLALFHDDWLGVLERYPGDDHVLADVKNALVAAKDAFHAALLALDTPLRRKV